MASSIGDAARKSIASLKETRQGLTSAYQDTVYDIGESLVFFTPLKTGLASSNWGVSNSGSKSVERDVVSGTKGKASLDAILSAIPSLDFSKVTIFNNPVDYIDDLERGTSPQARAGMITPTKARITDLWLKNLKKHKVI